MQDAAERMGLDLEDLQEMINEVLDDCSTKSQLLKEAIEAGDSAKIKSIAHDIKGSTGNYGLKTASELALKIEKGCENSTVDQADELIRQFEIFRTLRLDEA